MSEKKLELEELRGAGAPERPAPQGSAVASGLDAVYDVPVQVSAVLGTATLQVGQLLKLEPGAVIELDRRVGERVDILVNDRLVARGEITVVDGRLAVTMTEIVKSSGR